jgi:hypothetical protein
MPDEFASFRYEYVSGVVNVFITDGAFFFVNVTNRGSSEGQARAFVINSAGNTIFDSSDQAVSPGETTPLGTQVDDPRLVRDDYHARIFTTSLNLVPSARGYSVGDPNDEDTPALTDVYFAPNDFARFDLPFRPNFPRPPIGPIEGA